MTHKPLKLKRILRGFGIVLLAALGLLYLALPIGMGIYTVLPGREAVGGLPEGFEHVKLETDDGVKLAAWYQPQKTAQRSS